MDEMQYDQMRLFPFRTKHFSWLQRRHAGCEDTFCFILDKYHPASPNAAESPHIDNTCHQARRWNTKLYIPYISYLLHLYNTALNVSISFHYCPLLSPLRVNTFCSNMFFFFSFPKGNIFVYRTLCFAFIPLPSFFFYHVWKLTRVIMCQPTHCIDRK